MQCTLRHAEMQAADNSTWVVSGWGTTSANSNSNTGMDGNLAGHLRYGFVKHLPASTEGCASFIGESSDIWWVVPLRWQAINPT